MIGIQRLATSISLLFITFATANADSQGRVTYLKQNNVPTKCCGAYIRADVGYSWPTAKINSADYANKPKGALVTTFGIGQLINSKIRADITASYRGRYKYSYTDPTLGYVKQVFSSTAIMLNGYLSPRIFKYAIPYAMVGAGIAINRAGNFLGPASTTIIGDSSERFAWQVGLGSLIKISNDVNADVVYKYVDLGNMKTNSFASSGTLLRNINPVKGRLKLHELSIGISYFF